MDEENYDPQEHTELDMRIRRRRNMQWGQVCIADTRMPLWTFLRHLRDGGSIETFCRMHKFLDSDKGREKLWNALQYVIDNDERLADEEPWSRAMYGDEQVIVAYEKYLGYWYAHCDLVPGFNLAGKSVEEIQKDAQKYLDLLYEANVERKEKQDA